MGSCFSVGLKTGNSVLPSPRSHGSEDELWSANLKSFSFNVLERATRNFHPDSVLGKGRSRSVFKGWIAEQSLAAAKPGTGTVIAVKQLFDAGYESDQEWLLNHQNLVKIIGYCLEGDHRLLVYEFMRRSSLDNHLFRRGTNFERLSWNLRIKVALGVAKGLAYLHSTDVRYHGFKSSNILIDSNYNAKPSDFGLVKDGQEAALQTSVASVAYKPPEYKYRGRLTTSCEIYSFGVLLLELLTGRRSFDENRPSGEQTLVEFAEPFLTSKQKILLIMDPSIEGQYSSTVAKRAALLATKCLMLDPKHRPNSEELVKALEQIQELQKASESSTNDNNVVSYSRLVASTSDGV